MVIDRLKEIVAFKGISKRKFYADTGLSNGMLDKAQDIGVSKIEKITSIYQDINPTWLLTGRGSMLLDIEEEAAPPAPLPVAEREFYERMLKEQRQEIAELNRRIGALEVQLNNRGVRGGNSATGSVAQAG